MTILRSQNNKIKYIKKLNIKESPQVLEKDVDGFFGIDIAKSAGCEVTELHCQKKLTIEPKKERNEQKIR